VTPGHTSRRALLAWAAALPLAARGAELAETVAAIKPSIVAIGTFNPTDNPRFTFRGTGFAVGDGNLVVTNFHVLPTAADTTPDAPLSVQIPRGSGRLEPRRAELVASDRNRDLALLRIDGTPLLPVRLAEAGAAREGQAIALIGFPIGGVLGFSPVTHRGIVASITAIALPAPTSQQLNARAISALRDGAFEVYQLDATAYPGNSGGPVFDAASGEVIGVVNMVLVRGTRESALSNPTGISYAIPVRFVRDLLARR
jgi:S1-C subfamily serine protease